MAWDDMPLLTELGPSNCRSTINLPLLMELFRGKRYVNIPKV